MFNGFFSSCAHQSFQLRLRVEKIQNIYINIQQYRMILVVRLRGGDNFCILRSNFMTVIND